MLESYLISVAIKSTVLLAVGVLCLRFLRRQDAALRHLVCLAALASAATVPLLALWSPQWSVLISVPAGAGAGSGGNTLGSGWASWPMALATIWVLGTSAMVVRALGGWIMLLRVRRRSIHFESGDHAEIRIGDVSTPLTCSVMRPLILLPAKAREWDDQRLRAVLLHESAHVRRRDCMAKYIAQGTRALLWWNPLAWILAARLNHEQELACDDAVLSAGVPAKAYATILLDVARECSGSLVLGCSMGGNKSAGALRERFQHLFEWRPEMARSTRRTAIAIPLLLLLLTTVSLAEKIYKVGPGILAPKVLERQNPVYPDKERSAKIEGKVVLGLVVGTDGHAHDIKVTKSVTPALDASAVSAVSSWLFQPGTKKGKPVPIRTVIEINFRLL
jgi:TonB family protein